MRRAILLIGLGLLVPGYAVAADDSVGQVRNATGLVDVVRSGATTHVATGDKVFQEDVISTGVDGSVGIVFADNSLMSLGPNSELKVDQFQFDPSAHTGFFHSSLGKGTLAAKSGLIVQQHPEAMQIKTPTTTFGVRGTEFVVRATPVSTSGTK
jgi:hypothetical protein